MSDKTKSVLLIDFDNMFGQLFNQDEHVALYFAHNLKTVVKNLETWGTNEGVSRDFIYKAVYMNVGGSVKTGRQPENGKPEKLFFSQFRNLIVGSGFLIFDCPTFNLYKNAADIRMVVDVLQNIDGRVQYDELVVMSGDSDFTPLLQCIRSKGKQTMLVSAGQVSEAYKNVANIYLPHDQFFDLIDHMMPDIPEIDNAVSDISKEVLKQTAIKIKKILEQNGEPVLLSQLNQVFSELNLDGKWGGYRTMTDFLMGAITEAGLKNLAVQGGWVWNRQEHTAPQPVHVSTQYEICDAPSIVETAVKIAYFPKVKREHWDIVIDSFAQYGLDFPSDSLQLTHCTKWVRDRLEERNISIARGKLNSVASAISRGGVHINGQANKNEIRVAILKNTLDTFQNLGHTLSENDETMLRQWIGIDE